MDKEINQMDKIDTKNTPQAPNVENIQEENKSIIPSEIPQAKNVEIEQKISPPPMISTEFLKGVGGDSAKDTELASVFVPFDGEWMPDSDPIEIGPKNYKTLQNYRYAGDKIIHLESVLGYSKINTTSLSTYSYENIRNGHQLKSPYTLKTYVLVHTEHDTPASNYSRVYQNQTTIPDQGNFSVNYGSTGLHTDSDYSLEGRFSDAPGGQVAYCNGKESCIWAGEEMKCAGFFTIAEVTSTQSDFVFSNANETITTTAGDFNAAGFKAGDTINITGGANDGLSYVILAVGTAGLVLYLTTAPTDQATGTTITIACDNDIYYNVLDYTKAANNDLTTSGNVVPIGSGIDSYTVLLLHCNGTDRSTTFTDSSATPHTPSAQGDAQIDTSTSKFGSASGLFDGTGDYLTIPDHVDWYMGAATFTIDFWLKFNVIPDDTNTQGLFQQYLDATHYVQMWANGTNLAFRIYDAGTDILPTALWSPSVGTWYHIAIIRGWDGSANKFQITIDGVATGAGATTTDEWPNLAAAFEIGRFYNGSAHKYFNGWIEEFSVTKGLARWTSDFTPRNSEYRDAQLRWYVFSTRPLQGVKYYISEPNTIASTLSGGVWNGKSFSTLSLTDGTSPSNISLAQTGSVTFASTVGEAQPWHFAGLYLYAYVFELSAGNADIRTVTVDAPFQNMVDLWDGVYRQPIQCQYWRNSGTIYKDYTLEVNESSTADYPIGCILDGMTTSDHLLLAFEERTSAVNLSILFLMGNTNSSFITIEYWNGLAWTNVGKTVDTTQSTINARTINQSGLISWNPPGEGEEVKQTLFDVTAYFYKLTVSALLSGTYGTTKELIIDTITGIPAQALINPFKFSTQFKNRLMLCGFTEGKKGNRIDYSVTNAPSVFNGDESSRDEEQSLFVGGREDLTCAVELFNRFGASIISSLLLYKNNETYILAGDGPDNYKLFTISRAVGCPAPLTLVVCETGYTFAEEINRNIAIWMSYSGPMIFDGSAIIPVKGIDKYFDPAKSTCVKFSIIEKCRAWYDATYKEYNLLIPSGSSASNCNVWLVYDLVRKRWFEKVVGSSEMPQCAFPVVDTDGVQYIYAGIDDGYLMRLENGNSFADDDDTGIAQTIETGDFFPSGNMWDITSIRRIKTIVKKITESGKNLAVTWYKDTEASGTSLTVHDLDAGDPISKFTQGAPSATPLIGWCHRFKFSVTTSDTAQLHPIGFGYQYSIERNDERDV